MKTLKLVLKGLLLYITTLMVVLFISGIDSIYEAGYLIPATLVCAILCCISYYCISKDEFEILTMNKWLNRITNGSNDNSW